VKNTFKLFGMQSRLLYAIALLAVIAFLMAACDSGFGGDGGTDSRLNDTWVDGYGNTSFIFNNGSWELTFKGVPEYKGTYTTNGNTLTMTTTHISGGWYMASDIWYDLISGKWYSKAELTALGFPKSELDSLFFFMTVTYSISGNTLYMTYKGETEVLYKR